MSKTEISVVVPVYKCTTCINKFYEKVTSCLDKYSFEIIMINDSSPENDWQIINELAKKDDRVKGLNFSRNFGQHYAITAGLEHVRGDWIIVMDCDLQDKPEEIINLYNKAKEGFDIVFARRTVRKDKWFKKSFSKLFYYTLAYLTATKQDNAIGNFGIYHKKVINAILSMKDNIRYFPTMVRWVGFTNTSIDVEHMERETGKTSYSLKKLINLALDVMLAFSDKPLRLTVKLGLLVSVSAFLFAVFSLIRYFTGNILVPGWTSLIVSVWFLSGIIVFVLGIVGLYIGKTYEKVKDRPSYIVKDYINIKKK